MITTIVVLSIFLLISLGLNIFFVWYGRNLLENLTFVSDNIGDFLGVVTEYSMHLNSLYEMETFYGDETLQALIKHTKFLLNEIDQFKEVYTLTRDLNDADPKEDTEEAEEESLFH
jgi:hypothetical protein